MHSNHTSPQSLYTVNTPNSGCTQFRYIKKGIAPTAGLIQNKLHFLTINYNVVACHWYRHITLLIFCSKNMYKLKLIVGLDHGGYHSLVFSTTQVQFTGFSYAEQYLLPFVSLMQWHFTACSLYIFAGSSGMFSLYMWPIILFFSSFKRNILLKFMLQYIASNKTDFSRPNLKHFKHKSYFDTDIYRWSLIVLHELRISRENIQPSMPESSSPGLLGVYYTITKIGNLNVKPTVPMYYIKNCHLFFLLAYTYLHQCLISRETLRIPPIHIWEPDKCDWNLQWS